MYFWPSFLNIVHSYPDHIAIHDRGRDVTYNDLYRSAKRFGAYLKHNGIKAEDIVALSFEKSADYIIALIGCWYVGAAFAPLPPSLPLKRRDFILKDLNAKMVIDHLDLSFPDDKSAPYPTTPDHLAYVIYTSGSTGKPKGVMVEHSGIVNFIEQQIKAFEMTPDTVSFFHLSINFDASISDIGCALLSGACLVIEDDPIAKDPVLFLQALNKHNVSCIDMPPSLMKVFTPNDMPPSLKTIVIGGEASAPETVRAWAKHFNLVNVYGPTEATVCTSLNRCDSKTWETPIIGQALDNVSYHILSQDMSPTDDGELYIGGIQLARGYLNRPDLNQEKFIFHHGIRLYKTGDHVRKMDNGDIMFLGRMDRQFKLRGQLVEPEEVEQSLKSLPHIQQAAALKIKDRFVAFVTFTQDNVITDDIKKALSKTLPAFMIPDLIIPLDDFPKTASGKVDYTTLKTHSSLNTTHASNNDTEHEVKSKCTNDAIETTLCHLWTDILEHDNFTRHSSFFDVGGDSLNIMRLSIACENAGLPLSVAGILKYKTIKDMAHYIRKQDNDEDGALSAEVLRDYVREHYLDHFTPTAMPPSKSNRPYQNILFTGGTGFLGGRVLEELILNTDAKIYCLVRAENDAMAGARLPITHPRLIPVAGNIALEHFGWSSDFYQKMSQKCDAVYHNAAWVNTVHDFDTLRPTNLDGCFEILKFATTQKNKDIHYASTLSVFVATDQNSGTVLENDTLDKTEKVYGGYAQTKWAADWMFSQMSPLTCRIWNYRFGLITGDSLTGVAPSSEFLSMFFAGVDEIGVLPKLCDAGMNDLQIDITPVDYAAKAMCEISLNAPAQVYHIANPVGYSYAQQVQAMTSAGMSFDMISLDQWLNLPEQSLTTNAAAAYLALCRVLPTGDFDRHRMSDLFQATDIVFDQRNTVTALAKTGIDMPVDLNALMVLYIQNYLLSKQTDERKHCA